MTISIFPVNQLDLTFRAANATVADISLIRQLAERIWRASYAEMLAPAQIDYMLDWMYSAEALVREFARGVGYRIAEFDQQPAGYFSVEIELVNRTLSLHKMYLEKHLQGRGLGQRMLREVFGLGIRAGCERVELRVNRHNQRAIRAYERAGFVVVHSDRKEIGGGFVMDDLIMSRALEVVSSR